ncbi:hypothetical protein SAMN02787118_119152 [Streptomyces mirabilis]|uniref:Transposase DDE domain-containing protein n=1 Tax=Streptomyces mirabilis TaxID=68239 RepID=A0A1I2RHP5_9ACTN|nr:hypothetical protein SAMN02787118_119152 [Streptomyces mirabilis]
MSGLERPDAIEYQGARGAVATLLLITAVGCGGRSDAKTHGGFADAGVVTQPRYPTRIAHQGIESSERLGRHCWTIERTKAWLAGCRRLHRRYLRKAMYFLAFTSIACTLICYRRLDASAGRQCAAVCGEEEHEDPCPIGSCDLPEAHRLVSAAEDRSQGSHGCLVVIGRQPRQQMP